MRNEMEMVLKQKFRNLALKIRYEQGLTQSEMSKALVMSERSYEDIERGQSGCGALTIVLLLMKVDNPIIVLDELRMELKKAYDKAGLPV